MEVSGQLHTAIALLAGKGPYISIEQEAGRAPDSLDASEKK